MRRNKIPGGKVREWHRLHRRAVFNLYEDNTTTGYFQIKYMNAVSFFKAERITLLGALFYKYLLAFQ